MRWLIGAGLAGIAATGALAGGVERSTQSVAILFEQGRYAELNFGTFDPSVSGVTLSPLPGGFAAGAASGDMAPRYTTLSFGYKQPLSERLDLALILDQPIGADVLYPGTYLASPYALAGTSATLYSSAVTALLRYKMPSNVSVYGGLRYQTVHGSVSIPYVGGLGPAYTLQTNYDSRLGYVLGVAWEKPEIAARVALTYNSAITHTLDATETGPTPSVGTFETEVPQSWNLEFQTGVAKDTLLFGSVRWVDWTEFLIDPAGYPLATPLVSYASDRTTYSIGLGRRFSETWSGAVSYAYEAQDNQITGNLGPTDGFQSVALAATYTMDNIKITGGIRYVEIGDALTTIAADFDGNSGIGFGLRVGYSF